MLKTAQIFLLLVAAASGLLGDAVTITSSTNCNFQGTVSSGLNHCQVDDNLGFARANASINPFFDPATGFTVFSNADTGVILEALPSPDDRSASASALADGIFRFRTAGPVRAGIATYRAGNVTGFDHSGSGDMSFESEFHFEGLDSPLYLPDSQDFDLPDPGFTCTVDDPGCQITLGKSFIFRIHAASTGSLLNQPEVGSFGQASLQSFRLYEADGVTPVALLLDNTAVPEPGTLSMLALPVGAFFWVIRRKKGSVA